MINRLNLLFFIIILNLLGLSSSQVTITPSGSWQMMGTTSNHGASTFNTQISLCLEICLTEHLSAVIEGKGTIGNELSSWNLNQGYIQIGNNPSSFPYSYSNKNDFQFDDIKKDLQVASIGLNLPSPDKYYAEKKLTPSDQNEFYLVMIESFLKETQLKS